MLLAFRLEMMSVLLTVRGASGLVFQLAQQPASCKGRLAVVALTVTAAWWLAMQSCQHPECGFMRTTVIRFLQPTCMRRRQWN